MKLLHVWRIIYYLGKSHGMRILVDRLYFEVRAERKSVTKLYRAEEKALMLWKFRKVCL